MMMEDGWMMVEDGRWRMDGWMDVDGRWIMDDMDDMDDGWMVDDENDDEDDGWMISRGRVSMCHTTVRPSWATCCDCYENLFIHGHAMTTQLSRSVGELTSVNGFNTSSQ